MFSIHLKFGDTMSQVVCRKVTSREELTSKAAYRQRVYLQRTRGALTYTGSSSDQDQSDSSSTRSSNYTPTSAKHTTPRKPQQTSSPHGSTSTGSPSSSVTYSPKTSVALISNELPLSRKISSVLLSTNSALLLPSATQDAASMNPRPSSAVTPSHEPWQINSWQTSVLQQSSSSAFVQQSVFAPVPAPVTEITDLRSQAVPARVLFSQANSTDAATIAEVQEQHNQRQSIFLPLTTTVGTPHPAAEQVSESPVTSTTETASAASSASSHSQEASIESLNMFADPFTNDPDSHDWMEIDQQFGSLDLSCAHLLNPFDDPVVPSSPCLSPVSWL